MQIRIFDKPFELTEWDKLNALAREEILLKNCFINYPAYEEEIMLWKFFPEKEFTFQINRLSFFKGCTWEKGEATDVKRIKFDANFEYLMEIELLFSDGSKRLLWHTFSNFERFETRIKKKFQTEKIVRPYKHTIVSKLNWQILFESIYHVDTFASGSSKEEILLKISLFFDIENPEELLSASLVDYPYTQKTCLDKVVLVKWDGGNAISSMNLDATIMFDYNFLPFQSSIQDYPKQLQTCFCTAFQDFFAEYIQQNDLL